MQQPILSPENGNVLNSEEIKFNNNSSSNHQKRDGVTKLHNSTLLEKESESHDVTSATSKKHSKNFFNYFKGRERKHSSNVRSISKEVMPSPKKYTFQTNHEMKLKSNQSLNQNNGGDAETLNSSFTLISNQTKSDDVKGNTNNEPIEIKYNFKFFDSWKEQQKEGYKPFKLLKAANTLKEMSLNRTMNKMSNQRSKNKTEIDYGSSSMWNNNQTKPIINERDISIDNQPLTKTLKFFDSWKEQQQRVNRPLKMIKAKEKPTRTDNFITMGDLEEILRSNGYVKKEEPKASTTTKDGKKSTSVAFPQPTLVTYRDLIISTSISSSVIGMIVGGTILRNLWLAGGLFLGCWGYQIARNYESSPPTNVFSELLISVGRRLAQFAHFVYDGVKGLWFMYQTGQLSYNYWKQYAQLDDRFAITTKMDSWNEKFKEGKRSFDTWEKENEIGRKVLAGLRVIAYNKQGKRWRMTKYYQRIRESIVSRWEGSGEEFTVLLKGIRRSIAQQRLDEVFPRALAALEAWALLNLVGALFALSPSLLGFLAVLTGLVWPTWAPELRKRFSQVVEELNQQGRLESSTIKEIGKQRFYDKTRYNYFTRADGTRRWYRTGQSTKVVGKTNVNREKKQKEKKQSQKSWWNRSSAPSQSKGQRRLGFFEF